MIIFPSGFIQAFLDKISCSLSQTVPLYKGMDLGIWWQ